MLETLLLSTALLGGVQDPAAGPRFIANQGQWPLEARWRTHGRGACAWLTREGWWLELRRAAGNEGPAAGVALCMRFEGAVEGGVEPLGEQLLPGRLSFFLGADPSRWAAAVPVHASVRWNGLYPGIDLVAREGAGVFQYDLALQPGARLEDVRVHCVGQEGLALTPQGALVVRTAAGDLLQPPPLAWQACEDGIEPLAVRYVLLADDVFGFEAPARDPRRAALVDPALIWSTYLGGDVDQSIEAMLPGPGDSVIVTGTTESFTFPVTAGAFATAPTGAIDGFVSKLSADGSTLEWSTFLGGTAFEQVRGLAVGASGAVTVCGETQSTDFPFSAGAFDTTHNGGFDAFVTRLAPDGAALELSTYLGGPGADRAFAVLQHASGATSVAGSTSSPTFPVVAGSLDPTHNGASDGFVLQLDPAGALLQWGTFLGAGGDDGIERMCVDSLGRLLLAGRTSSTTGLATPGAFDTALSGAGDVLVAALAGNGASLAYATYLGGADLELPLALLDAGGGRALVGGSTSSLDFPIVAPALDVDLEGASEGFVSLLSSAGDALQHSTYLGGSQLDEVAGLALDSTGRFLAAGTTASFDFPVLGGGFDTSFNSSPQTPNTDVFVVRMAPDLASHDYGSFFGGGGDDFLRALALDPLERALLAGRTQSFSFPTTPSALQAVHTSGAVGEGFVSRLALLRHPVPYGTGKVNSFGGPAEIVWTGFPGLSDQDLKLRLQGGMPSQPAVLFHGLAPASTPFFGGTLYAAPPVARDVTLLADFIGFAEAPVAVTPAMVGQTFYFQWWFVDPGDALGVGLTHGLEVLFYP